MKTIIIFLFAFSVAISQNTEPFQRQFMLNDSSQYLNSENPLFSIFSFCTGLALGR